MHAKKESGKDPSHERHQLEKVDTGHKKGPNIRQTGKQWNKGNSLQQKETVEIIVGAAQRIPTDKGV
jgi:hypothetical protein